MKIGNTAPAVVALMTGCLVHAAEPPPSDPTTAKAKTAITRVDGVRYRVTIEKSGSVTVANKSLITGRTMKIADQMRAAVQQATGCVLEHELWFGNKLKGRLECSSDDR